MRIVFALVTAVSMVVAAGWAGHVWLEPHWWLAVGLLLGGSAAGTLAGAVWRKRFPAGAWEPQPGGGFVAPRRPHATYTSLAGLTFALALYALGLGASVGAQSWQTSASTTAFALFLAPVNRQAAIFFRCWTGRPELAVTRPGLIVLGRLRRWERIERMVEANGAITLELAGRFRGRRALVVRTDLTVVPHAEVFELVGRCLRDPGSRAALEPGKSVCR